MNDWHEQIKSDYPIKTYKELYEFLCLRIAQQIDHAVINDHRLVPPFGKVRGEAAVRSGNIHAVLELVKEIENNMNLSNCSNGELNGD